MPDGVDPAGGTSEAALCREPGMPSVQAVRQWARREPEFGAAYEAAKAVSPAGLPPRHVVMPSDIAEGLLWVLAREANPKRPFFYWR